MGEVTWQTSTGEGTYEVNPGTSFQPQYMFIRVDASGAPKSRTVVSAYPQRLQFCGVVGFQNSDTGPTGSSDQEVVTPHALNYESEIWIIPTYASGPLNCQWVWWRLTAGVILYWDLVYV